jgi:hypothetical protein
MSRISEYSLDTALESSDKLLGSNADGSTRNFKVDDLSIFLSETNTSGTSSSFTFKYKQSNPGNGDMKFTLSSGSTLANVTSLKVNKFNYDNYDNAINNALALLGGKDIIVYEINNRNNFGVYKVNSLQVDSDSNFYNLALTAKTSNGSIVNDKIYGVDIFPESGGDLTFAHHQNTASASWVINHNLGKFPSVSIKFSSSDSVYTNVGAFAGVVYTDENNLTINLAAAESGYAYLN